MGRAGGQGGREGEGEKEGELRGGWLGMASGRTAVGWEEAEGMMDGDRKRSYPHRTPSTA